MLVFSMWIDVGTGDGPMVHVHVHVHVLGFFWLDSY